MMLPGVEVARRRRVRAGQGRDGAYDGGVSRSETHRSRLVVTGAHHHLRLGTTPGTSRSQALLRAQETFQEQHSDNLSAAATTISSSNNQNTTENMGDNYDGRAFAHHHRSREETRGSKISSLWRRHSACSHSDPGGLAIEARNRLDELLQAAAHVTERNVSSSRRNLTTIHCAQSSHSASFIYSNDHRLEERSRRASVYNWLATCVLSMKQCLNRVEVTSNTSLSSSTSRTNSSSTTTSSRASGLSKNAMIKALPKEVMGVSEPDQDDDCPVCLEGLMAGETTITLLCNHTFHPHCLTPWISKHGRCPCCRASVTRHKHIYELKSRTQPGDEDLLSWVEAIIERDRDKMYLPTD